MELALELHQGKELARVFKKAPEIARVEYKKSLERVAAHVTREAQRRAPVGKHKGGGNLRQSIKYAPLGQSAFIVQVNAKYGIYVEKGTKPHVIVPRRKKALAFTVGGKKVVTKRVNHPGTKAQPFFEPAVNATGRYANNEMNNAMKRVLKRL